MVLTSFLLFTSVELYDQVLVLGLGYFLCRSKSVLIVLLSLKASGLCVSYMCKLIHTLQEKGAYPAFVQNPAKGPKITVGGGELHP